MNLTLYRKYRPQNFEEIWGQNSIKTTLQNEILSGQIAHAYLFTGPHGTGKTTTARILAKALNCQNRKEKDFEPCNKCDSCLEIMKGKSLDLIEMDAATHTQVDKVRENIVENVRFAPHSSSYKIFIIDEVHMLSTAAFNALLKTLEEPPAYIIFILCTTEIYKLPETIISRCQRFDFKKISTENIFAKLKKISQQEKVTIDDDVLQTIAYRSGGFLRDAESLLGQILTWLGDKKKITLTDIETILPRSDLKSISDLTESILTNKTTTGIELINKLSDDGVDLEKFSLDLTDYLRKMILIKSGLKNTDFILSTLPAEIQTKLITQTEKTSLTKLTQILKKFLNLSSFFRETEIPQLPLEITIIELTTENSTPNNSTSINQNSSTDKIPSPVKPNPSIKHKTSTSEPTPEPASEKKSETPPLSETKKIKLKKIKTTISEIKNNWLYFLKEIQSVNHSLPLIMQSACPFELDGNILKLGFEFEIHVKKMKDEKTHSLAEEILEKIFKEKIFISPVIITKTEIDDFKNTLKKDNSSSTENNMDEILTAFGGKVVE